MPKSRSALFRRLVHYCAIDDQGADIFENACRDIKTFEPGDLVIRRGEQPVTAFIVMSGWASRSISLEDGRNQVVNFMLPGDFFDLQVFVGQPADHTVRALTPLSIAGISRQMMGELFVGNSKIAPYLWWSAVQEEAILREQVVRNGRRSARERVAHLLLELHARLSVIGEAEKDRFRMPVGQTHIADALGLSYVHLSRVFSHLEKNGLIARARSEVSLLDRKALEELAHFSTLYLHLEPGKLNFFE